MNNFIEFKVKKEPYISIGWQIGNVCNYTCSYCLVRYPNYIKYHFPTDDTQFINFIKKVQTKYPDKKILLSIFGGEPCIWKLFKPFVKKIKQYNVDIRLITNGSRDIEWWGDIIEYINNFIVSYHTENSDPKHIIKLMKLVNQNKNVQNQINFMLKPTDFFENIKIAEEISEEAKCFILLKLLRKQRSSELFDYSDKQLDYLENNRNIGQQIYNNTNNFEYQLYSKCKDDAILKHKNVNEVLIHKINRWKGWECTAGIDSFVIDYKQDIYVCNKTEQKKGRLGNINSSYILPDKPFICEMDVCTCLQDILDCNKRKI